MHNNNKQNFYNNVHMFIHNTDNKHNYNNIHNYMHNDEYKNDLQDEEVYMTLSKSEWEAINLYLVFAFEKTDDL